MSIAESDVIVFAAHPDDAELGCGGTIADLTNKGYKVTIIDATKGEMGSRGTVEDRMREAQDADSILGVYQRINLSFEDGNLHPNPQYIDTVATYIRLIRPRLVLLPPAFERHPDHEGMHSIVRAAYFHAGLHKKELRFNEALTSPWRPDSMFTYIQAFHQEPDFIVDISETFDRKIKSVECYSSQVYVYGKSDASGPETYISSPKFMDSVHARARYFGSMIQKNYGEGFIAIDTLGINSMSVFL